MEEQSFANPRSVEVKSSRWNLYVTIVDSTGEKHELVASADHGLTGGDGIYVGTREEYDHAFDH